MAYVIIYANYIENGIYKTDENINNENVFKTFSSAKKKLIWLLKQEKSEIELRIKDVKAFNKKNV